MLQFIKKRDFPNAVCYKLNLLLATECNTRLPCLQSNQIYSFVYMVGCFWAWLAFFVLINTDVLLKIPIWFCPLNVQAQMFKSNIDKYSLEYKGFSCKQNLCRCIACDASLSFLLSHLLASGLREGEDVGCLH